ncbi:MAG: GNAT family N-acetyltransferase [Bacteroidetes bacterium]|nr:GNAT family N-acetyltransferase [Bacteroidota bacterium]
MKFVAVKYPETKLLTAFLQRAGNSLDSFRYFKSRELKCLENHLYTTLLVDDEGTPVAYGHLDQENGITWLGIAVAQENTGRGFGKQMMEQLLEVARQKQVDHIRLSVDNINTAAIALYTGLGFRLLEKKETISFYRYDVKKQLLVLVSTLAFMGKPIDEIISISVAADYALEFSSGLPYHEKMEDYFITAPVQRFAHNYFPAPEIPFVLNLASRNETIRQQSIQHCIRGIELSAKVKAPFFSAHAGFCIDPSPAELGNELVKTTGIDRNENWRLFINSVNQVLDHTKHTGVDFLIENNVLAKMNLYADSTNPLLCADAKEMQALIAQIDNPRLGILLDTAHLKVSSGSLGFSLVDAMSEIKPFVRCIHHSDNNGERDTNESLKADYWFLPLMPQYADIVHVLEVKKQSVEQVNFQLNLLKKHSHAN